MAYGITVNTGYEIHANHPNRSGKYGLVFPAPGKLLDSLDEANAIFDEVVEQQRRLRQDFVATLNEYLRDEKTLRTESGTKHPDAIDPKAFSESANG
jgi:hypothetical protein